MGRTPIPLEIWIDPEWEHHEKIEELREKGHTIRSTLHGFPSPAMPDLILSKAGHAWNDEMWPHLELALKRARARREPSAKPKKPKKVKEDA